MTWKSRLVHILVWFSLILLINVVRGNFEGPESSGCCSPAVLNFGYIVLLFLGMKIIGISGPDKVILLILYGLLLINLPFNFLLYSEGSLLSKFIYLTFGALSIWFFYIPYFGDKIQNVGNGNK